MFCNLRNILQVFPVGWPHVKAKFFVVKVFKLTEHTSDSRGNYNYWHAVSADS